MNSPKLAPCLIMVLALALQVPSFIPGAQAQEAGSREESALVNSALSGSPDAVQALRNAGPPGLAALMNSSDDLLKALRQNKTRLDDPANAALRGAIDTVAGQRDAYASGLYWFTDLEAAKTEARKTRRRILSLRLLGNLNEEYSCANSRFFRTVLYANAEVSKTLRENYVLHWKSVRPAPLLTIDMGDGRRIRRTITGNSIHYLLDPEGCVLDALPGIYSPQAFLAALGRAAFGTRAAKSGDDPLWLVTGSWTFSAAKNDEIMDSIRQWHGREAHNLCMEWLGSAIRAGAYDRELPDSKNTLAEMTDKVLGSAFPNRSGDYQITPPPLTQNLTLEEWQTLRFGKTASLNNPAIDALPATGRVSGNISSPAARHPLVIREFPYPTEFDPPKAMIERPAVQQALSGGSANAALDPASPEKPPASAPDEKAQAREEQPQEPLFPTDFDPPQIPKAMVERPILQQAAPQSEALPAQDPASPLRPVPSLAERMTPALWSRIADPLQSSVALDESSRRFMMQKLPAEIISPSEIASGRPDSDQSPFGRQLRRFEAAIARDMARNEYYYHNRIHQWLEEDREGKLSRDVEALNRRVYQDLFLTPDYDAWLGLVPEDTYTAIEKDGCACDKGAPPMRQSPKP